MVDNDLWDAALAGIPDEFGKTHEEKLKAVDLAYFIMTCMLRGAGDRAPNRLSSGFSFADDPEAFEITVSRVKGQSQQAALEAERARANDNQRKLDELTSSLTRILRHSGKGSLVDHASDVMENRSTAWRHFDTEVRRRCRVTGRLKAARDRIARLSCISIHDFDVLWMKHVVSTPAVQALLVERRSVTFADLPQHLQDEALTLMGLERATHPDGTPMGFRRTHSAGVS